MSEPRIDTGLSVDLIVGSIGRLEPLHRLISSLQRQTHSEFRLIVVEQADPVGVRQLLMDRAEGINWLLLESSRGLSRARNVGLDVAEADIVGFPDDDCWYDADTLTSVVRHFQESSVDLVIGRQTTATGHDVLRTPDDACGVTRENVWQVAMSSAIFARRLGVEAAGRFDEELGVGAPTPYQSGEETDLVLSLLRAGRIGWFDPEVIVRHPAPHEVPNRLSRSTGSGYGKGMGRVLAKHAFPLSRALVHVGRPLAGTVVALVRMDLQLAIFRFAVVQGRSSGYFVTRREIRNQHRIDH